MSIIEQDNSNKPTNIKSLTLVTFNVLFHNDDVIHKKPEYDFAEFIHTARRKPATYKLLGELGADFIALQEVTTDFFQGLILQPWVQENYFISDIHGKTVIPSGNILLSKFPFKSFSWNYIRSSKALYLAILEINNKQFSIGNLHLKAGNMKDFKYTRQCEIHETISIQNFCKFDDAVLLGDFNFREEGEEHHDELELNYVDCWKFLKNDEPGYTHDPARNVMALKMAQKSRSVKNPTKTGPFVADRYDRLYLKSHSWKPTSTQFVLDQPIGKSDDGTFDLFVSDHFGLLVTISVDEDGKEIPQ